MSVPDVDRLTGLITRLGFQVAVAAALRKRDAAVGLILIDIDEFAGFNGVLGRAAGNAALIELARRITHEMGRDALIARFADDEFAVLLHDTDAATLRDLARLCLGVVRQPLKGGALLMTASVGTALSPIDATEGWELINQAAVAQFLAKSAGRDRVVAAKPLLRKQIERSVHEGIAERRFGLNYQPIITLGDQTRLAGVEAFLRWHHPTRGLIFPAKFLPILEDPRMALILGEDALRSAAEQACTWIKRRFDFGRITLNVSMHQLRSETLPDDVSAIFARENVPHSRLSLDLPTDVFTLTAQPDAVARIDRLHALGVTLTVDAGAAEAFDLDVLRALPIASIRLRRGFADDLSPLAFNRLMRSVHEAGLTTIAEGVETVEQRDMLAAAGCDMAQGWSIGRPMPPARIATFAERLTFKPRHDAA